jgi:hypothetical protein
VLLTHTLLSNVRVSKILSIKYVALLDLFTAGAQSMLSIYSTQTFVEGGRRVDAHGISTLTYLWIMRLSTKRSILLQRENNRIVHLFELSVTRVHIDLGVGD